MKIHNKTGLEKITTAINYFQKVLPEVVRALKTLPGDRRDFLYTEQKNFQVVASIEEAMLSDMEITIRPWFPFNRFTSAIATTFADKPNQIFINMRKAGAFNHLDYANTLAHEFSHLVGHSHGSNHFTSDKIYSIPYALGALVSGESSWPLVKHIPRIEIPSEINLICERSWRTLWFRRCYPAKELTQA
jgi:hypothetical protein